MARKQPAFYNTIEYIGPRPQKPKKKNNVFGGWGILAISAGIAFWFGKPLIQPLLAAESGITLEEASSVISSLSASDRPGDRLAAMAISQSREGVTFDESYPEISFPGGDVPGNRGKSEDVIVRAYRRLDGAVDLQKEIHEDMKANFRVYPQLWSSAGPNPNIDHRRAQNLQRYFSRFGETLSNDRSSDFQPGDIVVWGLANGKTDIAIVVPPAPSASERGLWIVHNNGKGVKWESETEGGLANSTIIGHFRYAPQIHGKAAQKTTEAVSKAESF